MDNIKARIANYERLPGMRVYDLAKQMGVQSSDVLHYCRTHGINVKSASSKLEPILAVTVRSLMIGSPWPLTVEGGEEE